MSGNQIIHIRENRYEGTNAIRKKMIVINRRLYLVIASRL